MTPADRHRAATSAPLPAIELSNHGFVVALAAAGRAHVVDAMHSADASRHYRRGPRSAVGGDARCLFCRTPEPLGSEEHVLSVGLGNHFWILPPNVVCATCNHGVLSRLDTALQRHPFIAMIRTLTGIHGRSGKQPGFGASNLRVARREGGGLNVEADHPRFARQFGDEVRLEPRWVDHGETRRRITSRALLKTGLGLIRLACGQEESARPAYDDVRAAVLGDDQVSLQHGFGNSRLPAHALQITALSHIDYNGLRVSLDYFGVHLWAETAGAARAVKASTATSRRCPLSTHPWLPAASER